MSTIASITAREILDSQTQPLRRGDHRDGHRPCCGTLWCVCGSREALELVTERRTLYG